MGQVARITDAATGIRFVQIGSVEKRDIRQLIKNRFRLSYSIDLPATCSFAGKRLDCTVYNISATGCYLKIDITDIDFDLIGELILKLDSTEYIIPGEFTWVNFDLEYEKPFGGGVRFANKSRDLIRHLKAQNYSLELTR